MGIYGSDFFTVKSKGGADVQAKYLKDNLNNRQQRHLSDCVGFQDNLVKSVAQILPVL